jgi:hypothetical protein
MTSLLDSELVVLNLGVREFAESLAAQDVPVVQIDWRPPPELEDDLAGLLEALV